MEPGMLIVMCDPGQPYRGEDDRLLNEDGGAAVNDSKKGLEHRYLVKRLDGSSDPGGNSARASLAMA